MGVSQVQVSRLLRRTLNKMRETNDAFNKMMQKVNSIIRYVVTGEEEHEEGCTGSCHSCSGCH